MKTFTNKPQCAISSVRERGEKGGQARHITQTRHVRNYIGQPLDDDEVDELLRAAKSVAIGSPAQAWHYVVLKDKQQLRKLQGFNPYLPLAAYSPTCLLLCLDSRKENNADVLTQDLKAIIDVLLNKARSQSLGVLWTPLYPEQERMQPAQELFLLPEVIYPLALLVAAHPVCLPEKPSSFFPQQQQEGKRKKFIFF